MSIPVGIKGMIGETLDDQFLIESPRVNIHRIQNINSENSGISVESLGFEPKFVTTLTFSGSKPSPTPAREHC